MAIDASKLRRGRYFRENFAQAGIDLSQIIPELVTNADAAIAAAGRGGRRREPPPLVRDRSERRAAT